MSCPNLAHMTMPSSHSRGDELSLEGYAQAVRTYQAVLLELQAVNVERFRCSGCSVEESCRGQGKC